MTKTEELLAVLDMSENDQWNWIWENYFKKKRSVNNAVLADLAFRLRDEVVDNDLKNETDNWCESSYEVFLYVIGEENERDSEGLDTWFSMRAKPIHFIIAALIAKQKENEE